VLPGCCGRAQHGRALVPGAPGGGGAASALRLLLRPLLGPLLPLPAAPASLPSDAAPTPASKWDAAEAALLALLERAGALPVLCSKPSLARSSWPGRLPHCCLASCTSHCSCWRLSSAPQLLPFLPAVLAIALDLLTALYHRASPAQQKAAGEQGPPEEDTCSPRQRDSGETRAGQEMEAGGAGGVPASEDPVAVESGAEEGCCLAGKRIRGSSPCFLRSLGRQRPGQQPRAHQGAAGAGAAAVWRLLEKFPDAELGRRPGRAFFWALQEPLQQLGATAASSSSPGALFRCLQAVAERSSPEPLLRLAQHPGFLPSVLSLLASPKAVAAPVLAAALGLLESICTFDARSGDGGGAHRDEGLQQEQGLEGGRAHGQGLAALGRHLRPSQCWSRLCSRTCPKCSTPSGSSHGCRRCPGLAWPQDQVSTFSGPSVSHTHNQPALVLEVAEQVWRPCA